MTNDSVTLYSSSNDQSVFHSGKNNKHIQRHHRKYYCYDSFSTSKIKKWGEVVGVCWGCTKSLCSSKIVPYNFFSCSAHTNSIINPISSLPMPNVKLCLSYSWLRAESVGFGQKNVEPRHAGIRPAQLCFSMHIDKEISHPLRLTWNKVVRGQMLNINVQHYHPSVSSQTAAARPGWEENTRSSFHNSSPVLKWL